MEGGLDPYAPLSEPATWRCSISFRGRKNYALYLRLETVDVTQAILRRYDQKYQIWAQGRSGGQAGPPRETGGASGANRSD